MSFSGSPSTAIRSASIPSATVPTRLDMPEDSAETEVAVRAGHRIRSEHKLQSLDGQRSLVLEESRRPG